MGTAHFSKESREDVRSVMVLCKLKLNQEKCHLQINSQQNSPAGLFQFQIQMRKRVLMDKAVVLMDKNTMMKMVIRGQLDKDPNLKK